ncbi:MAG: NADH-quinone oxidoreductase subunit L [Candidatus Glassbacteria bacterium]|nr:NADH-quinone oxidoreductase subunit L [Candidatus Glassbacteria bacterium]
MQEAFIRWIVLFPLLGAGLIAALGRRLPRAAVGILACSTVGASFAAGLAGYFRLADLAGQVHPAAAVLTDHFYTWMALGRLNVGVSFILDPLSSAMVLMVAGVSFLIHVYSMGYMAHDKSYWRYFSYLNLFVFFMLLLITADSLPLMFIGWEGVGLCSYLLIGFWFEDPEKAYAGKKAFIVNRVGDFGFLLGIILLFWSLGTVDFAGITSLAPDKLAVGGTWVTLITLLLFLGATGKSAQIPLYVWLPDAMAGPTPVSALIHAATMVTAGVYMIVRLNVLYLMAPVSMAVVAAVGVLTAIYAASIGLVQNDIKKVLAYSTISQLGYMFLAVGVGAFSAGIFHLVTHAFFKALLFLCAGSVIHAMGGRQDIREMGGLRTKLPATYWTFLIATVTIAGLPPFSGFFSKDEILWQAFGGAKGHWLLWLTGFLAAGMTAFYMFRLLFLTFFGRCRADHETSARIHESPKVMTVPLVILAVLSALGGYWGVPEVLGGAARLHHWLAPVLGNENGTFRFEAPHYSHAVEYLFMALSVAVAAGGIYAAWVFYLRRPETAGSLAGRLRICYQVLLNKYYVDEIYNIFIVQPVKLGSTYLLWKLFDVSLVDGAVNLTGRTVRGLGRLAARLQNGYAQVYAISFLLGVALVLGSLLW